MASPQKENGYTPLANEILEQIALLPLNGTQFRILLTVWRYTYGFARKDHELSVGFISKALNCNRKQVQRELDRLIGWKIITIEKEASFNSARSVSFNKDYAVYQLEGRELIRLQVTNKTMEQGANQTTQVGANPLPKKENIKQKEISGQNPCHHTGNTFPPEFELFYSQYPNPKEKQRTFTNWRTALKHSTAEELIQASKNYADEVKGRQKEFIKTSANFLGKEKPYLDYMHQTKESPPRREIKIIDVDQGFVLPEDSGPPRPEIRVMEVDCE
jgi:phage replication O-like protein O